MGSVRYEILKNGALVSSQPGLVSFCEAVHAYLSAPGTPGDKHEFRVCKQLDNSSEVVDSEEVTTPS